MADDRHYVPGDFYRIDDRTGFKVRARRTRKEWTNAIVDQNRWEARHPQDFVRGVNDDQTVPEPRPRSPNQYIALNAGGSLFMVFNNEHRTGFFQVLTSPTPSPGAANSGTAGMLVWDGTLPIVTPSSYLGNIT